MSDSLRGSDPHRGRQTQHKRTHVSAYLMKSCATHKTPTPRPIASATGTSAAGPPTVAATKLPPTVLFRPGHPLHESHLARRLPVPCYPRFLGVLPQKPPPHDLDGPDAQGYYAFVLGTFRAHRITPVPEGLTLRAAYENFVNVEL